MEAAGVMIVRQNHADFIETADQVLRLLRLVNSQWLAVNLDIGSFRIGDPYAEVAKVAPHAATWQIKENLFVNGREEKTDLGRIVRIVREAGYRGYLPIETLGPGDPRVKVPKFLAEVRKAHLTVCNHGDDARSFGRIDKGRYQTGARSRGREASQPEAADRSDHAHSSGVSR